MQACQDRLRREGEAAHEAVIASVRNLLGPSDVEHENRLPSLEKYTQRTSSRPPFPASHEKAQNHEISPKTGLCAQRARKKTTLLGNQTHMKTDLVQVDISIRLVQCRVILYMQLFGQAQTRKPEDCTSGIVVCLSGRAQKRTSQQLSMSGHSPHSPILIAPVQTKESNLPN